TPMRALENDRWRAIVSFPEPGRYEFRIAAWRDLFTSWRVEVTKKHGAGQKISLELEEGKRLVRAVIGRKANVASEDRRALKSFLAEAEGSDAEGDMLSVLLSDDVAALMARCG